jgi:hypothetical protein
MASKLEQPSRMIAAAGVYITGDTLALNFGGRRSSNEITVDQVRRFTDTAGLPTSPVWEIVREVAQRTAAEWKTLDQKDLLPVEMRKAVEKQVHAAIVKMGPNG